MQLIFEVNMSKFMKTLNNISRSQAIFRQSEISAVDLMSCHYAYALTISKKAGCSQEEIAQELCVNKSTVTRTLNYLEEKGYICRKEKENDKRQMAVFPTEKLLLVLPEIKDASARWMALLSEGISKEDLLTFNRVLKQMETKAKEITYKQEENK